MKNIIFLRLFLIGTCLSLSLAPILTNSQQLQNDNSQDFWREKLIKNCKQALEATENVNLKEYNPERVQRHKFMAFLLKATCKDISQEQKAKISHMTINNTIS